MHCTAKSKRSGKQCQNKPVRGRTVCRMHGGKSLRGIAHPNYQTGRYAKDLSPKLAERFKANLHSRKLTSLGEDLALCDLRISELLRELTEKRESLNSPLWRAIWEALAHRRKLVEAYDKHAIVEKTYVPIELARQVIQAIATMTKVEIQRHTDPETFKLLASRLSEGLQKYLPPEEEEDSFPSSPKKPESK